MEQFKQICCNDSKKTTIQKQPCLKRASVGNFELSVELGAFFYAKGFGAKRTGQVGGSSKLYSATDHYIAANFAHENSLCCPDFTFQHAIFARDELLLTLDFALYFAINASVIGGVELPFNTGAFGHQAVLPNLWGCTFDTNIGNGFALSVCHWFINCLPEKNAYFPFRRRKLLNFVGKNGFFTKFHVQVMSVIILGIESSCDDTAAAIVQDGKVRSNCIAGQEVHRLYGGVVPEAASRAHLSHIVPVVQQAMEQAGVALHQVDAIAFTRGPGLMGSLLVGVSFAKSLALSLQRPLIEVNHLLAHVASNFADPPMPNFPMLCLTVSGGHTQIVQVDDYLDMRPLGQTLDDAAGEAFDKTGKLLGIEYPSGPLIDRLAQQGQARFAFPEPQVPGLDFSFSGLKTSILHFLQKHTAANPDFVKQNLPDICASVQHRIVTILMRKLEMAAAQTGIREVAIAGGVSANSELRRQFQQAGQRLGWKVYIPRLEYCTDNAAMIALAGYFKYLRGDFVAHDVTPMARWSMV